MSEQAPKETTETSLESINSTRAAAASSENPPASLLNPQSCPTCGTARLPQDGQAMASSYVYALGRITPRFPTPSAEKEFAQVVGRDSTKGLTDPEVLHKILSEPTNRYLARTLCWVIAVEGLETYILIPRDPVDLSLLIETLRPRPKPGDLDMVVGVKGPIAPPQMCNGLMVPIVMFDQIYSFDRDSLIRSIPRPEGISAKEFAPTAEDLFDRIMQMTDNAGSTDEHRALNYLAVRYPRIYEGVAEALGRNDSLSAVNVQYSSLAGTRRVVEVIFSFTNRNTDVVSKQFVRVDVSEEFPFLVTKLSPYYDRSI